MDELIKRISHWENSNIAGPFQVQLHLTNLCNLKCHFCPTRTLISPDNTNADHELSAEEWVHIIQCSERIGVKEWHICGGGEPFFDKEKAMRVIAEIKKRDMHCEIITNGTLLDSLSIKQLIQIGIDKITISLDGHNATTHDDIRGVACFNQIIKNISLLFFWKKQLRAIHPRVALHIVVCNKNFQNIKDILKLAKKLNVDDVLINALNIWSKDIRNLELDAGQKEILKKLIPAAQSFANKIGINTNIDEFFSLNLFEKANVMEQSIFAQKNETGSLLNAPCFIPWYNMAIFSDGECKPCFILKEEGESLKKRNLTQIWQGKLFSRIRRDMIRNRVNKDCSKCNPWSYGKNSTIREELKHGRSNM
jgi:MoaA/NifB/PqqE/SkfB family radical SAM enzyme